MAAEGGDTASAPAYEPIAALTPNDYETTENNYETTENKMQASLEYGNEQPQVVVVQQPQTEMVVVQQPQTEMVVQQPQIVVQQPSTMGQQNIQRTNYTFANNNNVTAVQTVAANMAMDTNVGYFQPRDDTGEYVESMKPWDSDQQIYSFAACTEFKEEWQLKKRNIDSKGSANTEAAQINTVFHKQGSQRLIVKRKDSSSTLTKAKNNPLTLAGLWFGFLGVVAIVIGGIIGDSIAMICGAGLIVVGLGMIFCFQKRKDMMSESNIITQSIPIQAIFFVERFVQQTEMGKQCCCDKEEEKTSYSEIAIGYNRSNLSNGFAQVHGASTEDYLKFKLVANQAYNLHQYINTIIDGSHPQMRNLGSSAMNALPS